MASTRHVVLVGLMGSGKSTIGRMLATRLGRPFVDNDLQLEERTGRTAREVADAEGADALHRRETEALVTALASPEPAVVAAAAAAPMEADAEGALGAHDVVYLRAPPAVLAARLEQAATGDGHRPFVTGGAGGAGAVVSAQFDERDARYRAIATLIVDSSDRAPESIVDEISSALGQ